MDDHHFTAKSEKLKRRTLFLGPLIWKMLILKIGSITRGFRRHMKRI
jgi:hypothetical protein